METGLDSEDGGKSSSSTPKARQTPPPSPPSSGSGVFSPLKRKRPGCTPPPSATEIPETPWQMQTNGQEVSLGSRKLERQLEEMTLECTRVPLKLGESGSTTAGTMGDVDMDAGSIAANTLKKKSVLKPKGRIPQDKDEEKSLRYEDALKFWEAQDNGQTRVRLVSPPLTKWNDDDMDAKTTADDNDSEEDGVAYGVGFKPSAQQSYVRAQKKQQQVRCHFHLFLHIGGGGMGGVS